MKSFLLRPVTIVILFCLVWFFGTWLGTGYAIDDTYIHLTYARNLAEGHGFAFYPSDGPLYSCTSPAWVMLLSMGYRSGIPGLAMARLLSCLAGALTIFLLYLLAETMLSRKAALFPPILLALNPWWIRWSSSGMETASAGLFVVACLLLHVRGKEKAALTLSGFGIIVRPELAVLGAILLLSGKRKGWLQRLAYFPFWILPTVTWVIFAWIHFGSPVPSSALSKVSNLPLISYLLSSLTQAAKVLIVGDALPATALIFLVVGAAAGRWSMPRPGKRWLPFLLLPPAILAVVLTGRGPVVSRYILPAWPVLVIVEVKGMQLLAYRIGKIVQRAWKILPVTAAVLEVLVLAIVFIPHMTGMERNLHVYRNAALYIRDSLPSNAIIAVREVGVFGYMLENKLIDLEGLVTPEITPSSYPGLQTDLIRSVRLLRQLGVTHIMDPIDKMWLLEGNSRRSGLITVFLKEWSFPGGTSLGGSDYTRELYRLEWCSI